MAPRARALQLMRVVVQAIVAISMPPGGCGATTGESSACGSADTPSTFSPSGLHSAALSAVTSDGMPTSDMPAVPPSTSSSNGHDIPSRPDDVGPPPKSVAAPKQVARPSFLPTSTLTRDAQSTTTGTPISVIPPMPSFAPPDEEFFVTGRNYEMQTGKFHRAKTCDGLRKASNVLSIFRLELGNFGPRLLCVKGWDQTS